MRHIRTSNFLVSILILAPKRVFGLEEACADTVQR